MLSACGAEKDNTPEVVDRTAMNDSMDTSMPAGSPEAPTDAASYIAKAGAGDLWEVEASKALIAKSQREDVKIFARMMIDDHGKAMEKVKAAAGAALIEINPPKLDADQQRMLEEITKADAANIDGIYLSYQRMAHDAALALHRAYAASGDIEGLKRAAEQIVPVVEKHITDLQKLEQGGAASVR